MFQHLPGFRDFYPEDCAAYYPLWATMKKCAGQFGFQEYRAPILEPLELFTKKSGDEIVDQLFSFSDKGGRSVALRPEITPSLIRMVGAKIHSLPKPIRWFSIAECFRYERPQKGRLRSFYQFNADILGEESPNADAEVIALGIHILQSLGFGPEDFHVRLSDRQLWALFLKANHIPPELLSAVLVIIDRMGREKSQTVLDTLVSLSSDLPWKELLQEIRQLQSLQDIAELSSFLGQADNPEVRLEWGQRLETLSHLRSRLETMGYGNYITLDLSVVRGLAYYTGFVFEFFEREGHMRALAGGGRYDDLAAKLGCSKTDIPAVGLAIGDVTLQELLIKKQKLPSPPPSRDIVLVFASPEAEILALQDAYLLRQKGFRVTYAMKGSTKQPIKQFKGRQDFSWFCHYDIKLYGEQQIHVALISAQERLQSELILRENLLSFIRENFPKNRIP
ncbi:MAG: histidine--tRNA ligase [Puniceicoccales bacterium]|jgi:histidyl-tRNA synthetase|nr:histidine--tRNA ligase [Puniceicoccales bacterium]